jgi:hypothetical protein
MTVHDWYVEHRAAYVARALEPREERLFADHLARCEECTREVERLERELGWLPMAVRPALPRPGLTQQLLEGVVRRQARWRRVAPALAAAAMIVLATGLGLNERGQRAQLERLLAERERQLVALHDTISVMRDAQHVIQREIAMGGHQGGLLIFQDMTSHRWNVVMHGLPAAPAGSVYQFWFITDGGMVRSVELACDSNRPAFATVSMPKTPAAIMGAALTVESAISRSDEPKGVELMHVQF